MINEYDPETSWVNHIYAPKEAIVEICNNLYENRVNYDTVSRNDLSILDPIVSCTSEKEYDLLLEELKQYQDKVSFNLDVARIDKHFQPIYAIKYKIYEHEQMIQKYELISIVITIILLIYVTILLIFKKREQKKFEEIILKEQEKNVQNILMMNQDTHKLKHDLKHFFNQLMVYVENDEKEKVKELLKDYNDEIISLEIPAFTQNSVVDMILNHYISKAKKMKVDFTYSGTLVSNLNIKDRKLYILLSNALENAFIHSKRPKVVKMDMGCVGNYCRFVITNTVEKKEEVQSVDHGYGIISMKKS